MAQINEFIAEAIGTPDHGTLATLDLRLAEAGRVVALIQQFALYPDDYVSDGEEVGALASVLLSRLGELGLLIDRLRADADRRSAQAA